MTDQQWLQAWEIYRAAKDLPDERRRSYLATVSDDPEVFEEVLVLLQEPSPVAPPLQVQPGTKIGRYEIIDALGEGGMGQVFSARNPELERVVALKLLAPDVLTTRAAMDRLIREAKAASALNHPHIVTVHEVVRSGDDVAIAMEVVEGEALRKFCAAPQPIAQVIHWGRQIAQALAAAHARNIIHCDIKPENLMVRRDGYVKVLDFGLARQFGRPGEGQSSNSIGRWAGTLNYMAPERARGERCGAAGDIFSLGVVLFELVTGRHPFLLDSPLDTAHAIAHTNPTPPARLNHKIPAGLSSLLMAMLAKDPRERPTAAEVEQKLASLEAATTGKSAPRLNWALAIAFAVCVAGLGLLFLLNRTLAQKEPVMVQVTHQASENRVTAAALSPDGKYLAFAPFGGSIHLRRMTDGFTQPLNTPEGLELDRITWFSDGSRLLASGRLKDQDGIWMVPVGSGEPVLIMHDARDGVPSPDGARIAFTRWVGSAIWVSQLKGGNARQLVAGEKTTVFSSLVWSPDSRRIAYQRQETAPGVEQHFWPGGDQEGESHDYSFESIDVSSMRVVESAKGIVMQSACALEDGRILFVRWFNRQDDYLGQVWELRTDPHSGVLLGKPRRLTRREDVSLLSISASSDGKQVAAVWFKEYPNVYTADLKPGHPAPSLSNIRRLTFAEAVEYPHAWTADNLAVIFESNRNGDFELFRQSVGRSEARALVADHGKSILEQLSPDGKWVL